MASCKVVGDVVLKHGPRMASLLGVNNKNLNVTVCNYCDVPIKDASALVMGLAGLSLFLSDGNIRVYLFPENIKNRKDAMATLFHELLHVRLFKLRKYIKKNKYREFHRAEELSVQDIERAFIAFCKKVY